MRILIIQTAFLGDCILTTPLLRRTRDIFSQEDDFISILTTPDGAKIFENNPHINETIIFDKHGQDRSAGKFLKIARILKKKNFDIVISPHRSFRSGLLTFLAGIKRRVGFKKAPGSVFYSDKIDRKMSLPEPERMLLLLSAFNERIEPCPAEIFFSEKELNKANTILESLSIRSNERFGAIAPGSVWGTKRYSPANFAKSAKILRENGIVDKFIVIGGKKDKDICDAVVANSGGICVSSCDADILTSSAIIKRASFLMGNDSAPIHIASAVGTPVIAIFGPTIAEFGFTPYKVQSVVIEPEIELKCRPCSPHGKMFCPRKDHICMESIEPEKVAQAVIKLIGQG